MAGKGKKKITGSDEAGNKGGPGRPPLSQEEKMKKKLEKNEKSKAIRAIKKCEFSRLLQEEKVFKDFCEENGLTEVYQNYRETRKKRTEESSKGTEEQTREFNDEFDKLAAEVFLDFGANIPYEEGLQLLIQYYSEDEAAAVEENREMLEANLKAGPSNIDSNSGGEWQSSTTLITDVVANSSSAGGHGGPKLGTPFEQGRELKRKREEELDEARRGKRPATADNYTPLHPPIDGSQPSGFMADACCQTSPQSAAANLFSTSAWASKWEERLRKLNGEPVPGVNNGAHAIMDDFVKLLLGSSISHAIYLAKQYEKLQVKDAERRKQEQEVLAAASIDANPKFKEKKKEADDLKKQVEELKEEVSKLQAERAKRDEISFGPPGDPDVVSLGANSPPLQTASTGTNNVDQEDNIANRENKAAEADNSGMCADATSGSWYP